MKYIFTALLACTLGIGVAHAQSQGSAPPPASPPASGGMQMPMQGEDKAMKPKTGAGTSSSPEAMSTWPSNVTPISVQKGKKVEATGSFASGAKMSMNLPASCIAAADKEKFGGNQVLYGVELPAKSDMTITVMPSDPSKKLSVYAYTLPTGRYDLPSNAASVSTCKSTTKSGIRAGEHRVLKLTGGGTAQNVLIGVSGPADIMSGEFTVSVDVK